jgi:hypothetical protein
VITAIRAELFKLRTTRMYYGLLGIAAGLTLLIQIVLSGKSGATSLLPSLATTAGQRDLITNTGFALLTAAILGTIISSGEFRHKTITDTYLDQPDRSGSCSPRSLPHSRRRGLRRRRRGHRHHGRPNGRQHERRPRPPVRR